MLSIVIPTLNEQNYLPKLLESIKKQSYKDYEIIVADANSSDNTRQIARKLGCKLTGSGGLPAVGRNNGAKIAKGDVLFFIDADVILDKDFLEKSLLEFESRKLGVAGCFIRPIGNNILDKMFFGIFNFWIFSTQLFYPNASGSGIFCRRKLHEEIKGFDETIKLSEDMDYVKRAGKIAKFRILMKAKSHVAMRRFEKEGRLKVGLKLLLSVFHRLIFGEIRSDVFKYNLKYKK